MHILEHKQPYASRLVAGLDDDEYHRRISAAAKIVNKNLQGAWKYITQYRSGAVVFKSTEEAPMVVKVSPDGTFEVVWASK